MSMVRMYLYGIGQKVVIPTIKVNDDGMLIETAPVKVFDLSDLAGWKEHVYNMMQKRAQQAPPSDGESTPGSAVLDKLKVERWSDFEKHAVMYTLHKGAGYITFYATGKNEDGMWTTGTVERKFHNKAPLEVILDEVAAELIKQPEAVPKPTTLLLGG